MHKGLVVIIVVVVAGISFGAGVWANEARQPSTSKPPATQTTGGFQPDTGQGVEFCTPLDEPAIPNPSHAEETWHLGRFGCLEMDR